MGYRVVDVEHQDDEAEASRWIRHATRYLRVRPTDDPEHPLQRELRDVGDEISKLAEKLKQRPATEQLVEIKKHLRRRRQLAHVERHIESLD